MDKCEHMFNYRAYLKRWMCVKCHRVAPECFAPKPDCIVL